MIRGKWVAEVKPERKKEPKGFVTTNGADEIILNPTAQVVEQYVKVKKLIYDKRKVLFNVEHGEYLYFAENGTCFILKSRTDLG